MTSIIRHMYLYTWKSSSRWKCWEIHFPLQQSPEITAVHKQHDKLFSPWSQRGFLSPGISQMCSCSCLDLFFYHISCTEAKPQGEVHKSMTFDEASPHYHVAGLQESSSSPDAELHSHCAHSMSCLTRFSSSSDTVRFPMYQNIQNTRLRNMSRGPDSTKKSQKLRRAKIPTKKRRMPMTSKITARDKKKMVAFPCSMVAPGDTDRCWCGQRSVWMSDRSESLRKVSCESLCSSLSTPYISFIAQDLVGRLVSNHNGLCCSLTATESPTASFLCRPDLFGTFKCDTSTHCL